MKISLIILSLLLTDLAFAQNKWFVKAGFVHSSFKKLDKWDKIDPLSEFGFGFGREWSYSNNFYLSASIDFLEKGATLRHKTIRPTRFLDPEYVYYNDIYVHIKYFEIPVLFKHGFDLADNFSLKIFSGITFSIQTRDRSKVERKEISFSLAGHEDRQTDYFTNEESGFNINANILFNFGIELVYSNFALNLRYAHDNRQTFSVRTVSEIYKTMYSYQVFLVYYLS
jgi:Outer membrane protein beta-barrel domain